MNPTDSLWYNDFRKAHQPPSEEVVIDDSELIFHDPENLPTTRGMTSEDLVVVVENDIVPCSKCFPQMSIYESTYRETALKKL